ncbi:hypothetical protein [Pseudarthrobacter defluvii]|uniref:hypothetical protein n=1 Tax=Pseudarthrobacter defluvii TaxID=410837 RepID=UPI002576CC20|nr:hypothetical protein [Pseudarthrobacter defluvii]
MTGDHQPHGHSSVHALPVTPQTARGFKGRIQTFWHTITGALGLVTGLVPHVLHHIGFLAGSALVAGSGGTALFGSLGLLASIPALVHLHRRFHSWIAPTLGLLVFAGMFSLSAFVIGPAISGTGANVTPGPSPTADHTADHSGGGH